MSKASAPAEVQLIKTADLHFDPDNPRFYRLNTHPTEGAVIEEMFDDEGVPDLMRSIGQKGYFPGEPLLVAEENGLMVVVEGNRRLAAVKLLNKEFSPPDRRKNSVEQILSEAVEETPDELPCIVYRSRREVLRYLGYRHITGIKEWDSQSKAKYLSNIRDEFYAGLPVREQMQALANDIGSRSDYVAKLLTALNLNIKAEESNFFGLPMTKKDVTFSFITTALGYKNISAWLGLDSPTDIEQPNLKVDNLESLFAWVFVKNQQGRTILGESRNLKMVADIVPNEDAVKVLVETSNLNDAYLYSDGPQEALTKALEAAISNSQTEHGAYC